MMNAKEEILGIIGDEEIEAIAIASPKPNGKYETKQEYFVGKENVFKALKILDFEFDCHAGPNGYNVYAWTKTKMIFKGEDRGSEGYSYLPRNPVNIYPYPV